MRLALITAALLVAGCNDAGQYENEQVLLENEENGIVPEEPSPNIMQDTDYLNGAEPAENGADGNSAPAQ